MKVKMKLKIKYKGFYYVQKQPSIEVKPFCAMNPTFILPIFNPFKLVIHP